MVSRPLANQINVDESGSYIFLDKESIANNKVFNQNEIDYRIIENRNLGNPISKSLGVTRQQLVHQVDQI